MALVPYTLNNFATDAVRLPTRSVPLGGRDWHFTQLPGPYLNFGASVYPCAIVLAHYVATHPQRFAGARVVELGAGLGLASMLAAHVGGHAIATDGDDRVVGLCRAALDANGLPHVPAMRLRWGDADDMAGVRAALARLPPGPLVVIAADVVAAPYAAALPSLVGSVGELLRDGGADAAPSTSFLLVYQRRHSDELPFFGAMRDAGLAREDLPGEEVHPDFRGDVRPIVISTYRVQGGASGV
jgi:hypothetical protein